MASSTAPSTSNGNGLLVELGQTGLDVRRGVIYDEWLPEWKGILRHRLIREMSENEPVIASSLLVYEMLIRNATRGVQPADQTNAGLAAAEWLRGALYEDMSHTFTDFLSEVMSMIAFGWSWHHTVLKIRGGDVRDPRRQSRFTDGAYGWRKWPIRAQETWERWVMDEAGGVQAMVQRIPMTGEPLTTIPIEVSALFRMRQHKGSPEGMSLLRGAYKPWYNKKHTEIMQNLGMARDLAGIPMVKVPPSILSQGATGDELAMRMILQQLITGLERDQIKGFLFPTMLDPATGKDLYDFRLISPEGNRASTLNAQDVIKQYNLEMMLALMTGVMMIGHEQTGSFALHSSATEMLSFGLTAILDTIYDVINRHVVTRLWRLNAFEPALQPVAIHGNVQNQPLQEIGDFILRLSQAGIDISHLESEVLRRAGFPPPGQALVM